MATNVWNAGGYDKNARFVSDLGAPVLDLLQAQADERILDLGCGDGALTAKIPGHVIGLDHSPSMIAAAQARGLDARQADMHNFEFGQRFHAVFTNAVLHWTKDIDAVLRCVAKHLSPGGRFVGEFGGFGNVAAIETAWRAVTGTTARPYCPTPEEFTAKLQAADFQCDSAHLIPRPTPLPTGMRKWLETFRLYTIADKPEAEREAMLTQAEDLLRPSLCDQSGNWIADYVRLRFHATLVTEAGHDSFT